MPNFNNPEFNNIQLDEGNTIQGAQIQFVNDRGQLLHEENGKTTCKSDLKINKIYVYDQFLDFGNEFVNQNNQEFSNNVISLQNNDVNILGHIQNGNLLNISYDNNGEPIYEVQLKSFDLL